LFTSVGRRVELLRAFRRAYQTLGIDGHIIALDIDPLAPALQIADRRYMVPRLSSPNYIPTLLEICRREQVQLIFPLIDPDIPMLARHRAALEATGARLAVVAAEAAALVGDKWLTYQFFERLDLPTPRSWLPEQRNTFPDYPLFIKPRAGSAAKHTYKVTNDRELDFFLDYVPEPIIQEYLPGAEITNDVICTLDSEPLAVVSRRRMEVRWGEVAKGVTMYDPTIARACVRIARALPAVGPITVQCIMKDDTPCFTEINARFGGGSPLGIAAGVDSPAMLLARAAGIPFEAPPLGSYQTGLHITRFDDSFFLSEEHREQMARNHL
ncbi:MAG: ATP-grasp domain-containing protein, partial [Chloroflexaceae bacterium]|nr:ATP-grasp domain-containing protein [Chloroflexaceae bacterium]